MSDPVKTIKCTNCKLDILSSNYTTHCLHCIKNIYLCDKCEQPVNYKKKIEHDQTSHAVVGCSNCNTELEKYLLRDHLENNCCNRKVNCPICDIEVTAADISEHENYCGSRTEKCSGCGKFVMLKYKVLHIDSNHTFIKLSDEAWPSPSWQNGKRTLYNFMPDLSSETLKSFPDHKRNPRKFSEKSSNLGSHNNSPFEVVIKNIDYVDNKEDNVQHSVESLSRIKEIRTSSRKSDEWPALTNLRSLQISEEKKNKLTKPEANNSSPTEDSDLMYALKVSEEFNSHMWFNYTSTKHKVLKNSLKCLAENRFSGEKKMEKNLFQERNKKKENTQLEDNVSRNNLDYFYEQEIIKLPCEFCGSLIISNDLILHQSRCILKMTEPCNGTMHKMLYFDENDERILEKNSCGFCNKVFKSYLLDSHELHCKGNPTKTGKNQDKESYSRNIKSMNVKSQSCIQNGTKSNSPKLNRAGTCSEWFSEISKSPEGGKDLKNNLNQSETGGSNKTIKVSKKSRRAPSPPRK